MDSSRELASSRQAWVSARENVYSSSGSSDFSLTFSASGSVSRTDIGSGFKSSDTHSNKISLSKNIYSGFSCLKKVITLKKKKRCMHWQEAYTMLERKKWDLVIDLRNSLLSRLIRKRQIIRYNESSDKIHKVESYCKLIGLKKSISPFSKGI